MLFSFFKLQNYIPDKCYQSVYDIDYSDLYQQDKRVIIMDIDNTLIPYDLSEPTEEIFTLVNKLKSLGFKLVFVSNNRHNRVNNFALKLNCPFVASAYKPFSKSYRIIRKMFPEYTNLQMHAIGDQLMTDCLGAKRQKISCYLVKVLKRKSEKWYTKINRRAEAYVIKKIKNKYPNKFAEIISVQE